MGSNPLLNFSDTKDIIINKHGFAFAFNHKFYGLEIVPRFFDSITVSWIGFILAIMIFSAAFTPEARKTFIKGKTKNRSKQNGKRKD